MAGELSLFVINLLVILDVILFNLLAFLLINFYFLFDSRLK